MHVNAFITVIRDLFTRPVALPTPISVPPPVTVQEPRQTPVPTPPVVNIVERDLAPEQVIARCEAQRRQNDPNVFFHATTAANATTIIQTGLMRGSPTRESGHVYAWRLLPTYTALAESGAYSWETTA